MSLRDSFRSTLKSLSSDSSISKTLTSASTGSGFTNPGYAKILPSFEAQLDGSLEKSSKAKIADYQKEEKYGRKREEEVFSVPAKTMRRMYQYNPIVRAAVDTIINEVISCKWQVTVIDQETKLDDNLKSEVKEIESFFRHPNKNKENFKTILRKLLLDVLLMDSGAIEKVKYKDPDKKGLAEMYAIDGSTIRIKTDEFGMIQNYFQVIDEKAIVPVGFEKDELIYVQNWCRTESIYGLSPLETLHNSVTAFLYGENYNIKFFENNATPKGIIDLGGMVPERELDRFRQFWEAEQQQKPHRIMILGNIGTPDKPGSGIKWIPVAMQPKDYDMAKYLEWLMKIILMVYGVSPSKVGWTEEVKGAPATGQMLQAQGFKEKAIYPLMEKLSWYLTEEIIFQEFKNDKLKFEFIEEVSLQDKMLKAQIHQLEIMGQWKSVDEIRKEEGLEVDENQNGIPDDMEQGGDFDLAGIMHGLKGQDKPDIPTAYKQLEDNIKQYLGQGSDNTQTTIQGAFKDLEQNVKEFIGKSIEEKFAIINDSISKSQKEKLKISDKKKNK